MRERERGGECELERERERVEETEGERDRGSDSRREITEIIKEIESGRVKVIAGRGERKEKK